MRSSITSTTRAGLLRPFLLSLAVAGALAACSQAPAAGSAIDAAWCPQSDGISTKRAPGIRLAASRAAWAGL